MNDEEAVEYLSQLRQIGRWSAEMILMFTFNRQNIWPVLDLGLQKAISKNYKKNPNLGNHGFRCCFVTKTSCATVPKPPRVSDLIPRF